MEHLLTGALHELAQTRLSGTDPLGEVLGRSLRAMREHLDMDVAFVSEFTEGRRVFRHVDADGAARVVEVGASDPLEDSYCQRVVDGRLPELMHNACANAEALKLDATTALPVGAHMSVPIRFGDGRVFGTLCCFSFRANTSLTGRDLAMMRVLADMVGHQLQREMEEQRSRAALEDEIDALFRPGVIRAVYQPIFDVDGQHVAGFEALSRFDLTPARSPDKWFDRATHAGRGVALELRAIEIALEGLARIPKHLYVSLNASPETVRDAGLVRLLDGKPLDRLVLEITEHAEIESYESVTEAVRPLRRAGLRVAVDDAGAGYSCFRHVLNLAPEVIKLDISMTRGIDVDLTKRALATALNAFARTTKAKLVAEGVETADELTALRELGIAQVQGYYLGAPVSVGDVPH
jgi:EAL domain-containing protein (putative c-di-GMP-specific phosphodiesterase class I)